MITREVRRMYSDLDPIVEQRAQKMGATCRKGCADCCFLLTIVTVPEALLVAEHILELEDWESWLPRLRDAAVKSDYEGIENSNYFKKQIPCVFLGDDKTCRIYSSRPSACRFHYVVSDPASCQISSPEGTIAKVNVDELEMAVFNFAIEVQRGIPAVGPLPLMTLGALFALTLANPQRNQKVRAATEGIFGANSWAAKHSDRIATATILERRSAPQRGKT